MERFWICYIGGTDGGKWIHHFSLAEARAEAERLARLPNVSGKTVYVFECVGKCHVQSIQWEVPLPKATPLREIERYDYVGTSKPEE